jgi:hypothetical protein
VEKSAAIRAALLPYLDRPPNPTFLLHWDAEMGLWQSRFVHPFALPEEIRQVFERTGPGCLAAEANLGVVHVCHASDDDIAGFAGVPVVAQWQLILMPTAPLIRLALTILDRPDNPYRFESFLNTAEEDQARILDQLASQEQLYLAFYGDGLAYRFTKVILHDERQWQRLDELVTLAHNYWLNLPPGSRDFDRAKDEFMRRVP